MIKPPLRWAGGKTKLAPLLASLMPPLIAGRYIEPFVGAGGLAIYLHDKNLIIQAELSDQCSELINFWVAVKEQPTILGTCIKLLTPRLGWCRATYEGLRDWDRDLGTGDFELIDPLMRAARFWLLNRYGFNGLCRYNSSGEFNVPFGKWKTTPSLITAAELRALSDLLEWTAFGCCDFSESICVATSGDFIYCDPPYVPVKKDGFTSYSGVWGGVQQQSLFDCLQAADRRGVKWMLSAAAEPSIKDLYTRDSFKVLDVKCIDAARSISCNGNRGKAKELIIRNYL